MVGIIRFPIIAPAETSSVEHGGFNTPRHTPKLLEWVFKNNCIQMVIAASANQKFNIQIGLV